MARRRYGITAPLVVHCHHWEPTRGSVALERWALRQAELVVVDSEAVIEQLHQAGVHPRTLRVVPCGAGAQYHPGPVGTPARVRWLPSGTRHLVVAMGPLIPRKRPYVALETMARVMRGRRDVRFVWLGGGPLLAGCRVEARRLGIANQVVFPGHLTESEKLDLLRLATVFLHTSRLEGFPLAVLEAMGCGVPPVVLQAGIMPSLMRADTCRLGAPRPGVAGVAVADDRDLADAIRLLLDDSRYRDRLAEQARQRVDTDFRFEHTVAATETAYTELLITHASRP
jgi:glycosyltransferase involved in cell wall biosynthesis